MNWAKRIWRQAFFSDMNEIIRLGAQKSLQAEDFPELPAELDPEFEGLKSSELNWSSGSALLKSLLTTAKWGWIFPLCFYMANALFNLCGPVLVNGFVRTLQSGVHDQHALISALLYGAGVGLSGILAGLCIQQYFHLYLRRNQLVVNAVNTRLFKHALCLSQSARQKTPVGDIVNHMSTDTESVAEIASSICDLIYCTVVISGSIAMLFHYLGSTAWVALVLMGLLAPITRKVGRDFTRFDEELMKHRDERVSLMAQILNAIRVVKYFVWEKSVREEVAVVRAKELTARRRLAQAELIVTMLYVSVGTFVLFAVFLVHSWRGGKFDAALVFTCVSLFSLLEDPFAFISHQVSILISAKVGADRITRFLAQPAVSERPARAEAAEDRTVGFTMRNLSVRLGDEKAMRLQGIDLTLPAGQSLALVGPVGSGKSVFIQALLREVDYGTGELAFLRSSGEATDRARLGFVPQEAYILNGTLRENLSFGNENVSEAEIENALQVSALWPDVQRFNGGLDTEIGEKGVNLSGGQRQRLSLARAVLNRPQLVILDDPLSAVDAATEDHLVERLLFSEWRDITRVVVTHRLSHLEKFDQIAFLEEGRLMAMGSFTELSQSCSAFREYLREHGSTHVGHSMEAAPAEAAATAISDESSRITEDEDREYGAVKGGVYWDYILLLGGRNRSKRPLLLTLLFAAAASGTLLPLLQKYWLALVSNTLQGEKTAVTGTWLQAIAGSPLHAIYVYGVIGLMVLFGTLAADLFWLKRGLIAGRDTHDNMLSSVLGSSVRFFDSTPVGRILQRFSRDMEAIDIQLQWSFENSMKCLAQVVVTLTLIVASLPWVLVFVGPVLFVYYRVQNLYRASAREAKRLDSVARSPRYAHFKETLQGLTVIRAFDKSDWFLREFYNRLRHSQRMYYGNYMVNRWFSARIPVIGGLISLCTTFAIVLAVWKAQITPGMAGLLTVYSLSFWGVLNWGIRIWAEVEARMTSMERVKFYTRLPQEQPVLRAGEIPADWPSRGAITFKNVRLRYADHLPEILKNLSFEIGSGERVGLVGRTGSGKSTIFQALYRFVELTGGRILIDGVDIATVPLARLRKALAIIPQDPTLFMGSVRSNLDRYGEYTDEEIWRVLERTSLAGFVRSMPSGLQTALSENGANLSQGQRQLMCLARALLTKAKIVILDEATASVDVKTDAQVQRVVRESCQGMTMLIIAHRLGTIRDSDQILEIREGQLHRQWQRDSATAKLQPRPLLA